MSGSTTRKIDIWVDDSKAANSIKNLKKEFYQLRRATEAGSKEGELYQARIKRLNELKPIIDNHNKLVRGTSGAWNKSKVGLSGFVGFLAAGATIQTLSAAGVQLFNMGANLEQMEKKAKTVFGDTLPMVTQEAEKNARAMGMTNAQYIQATANMGDLLIPMKFSRDVAAELSTQTINLSGALAEWTAGKYNAAEVSDILSKAMLGEREQLKSLGISIMEADVTQRLMEKGMDKLTGTALQQAKALATLELITEKSADAQTAFAEGSESLTRSKAELVARTQELAERLASSLIPAFETIADIAEDVMDGVEAITEIFDGNYESAMKSVRAYEAQVEKMEDLNTTIPELIGVYDELSGKETLTKDEQHKLNETIARLSELVPEAIGSVDDYGNALDINKGKINGFLETETELQDFLLNQTFDELTAAVEEMTIEREAAKDRIKEWQEIAENRRALTSDSDWAIQRKQAADQIREQLQNVAQINKQIDQTNQRLTEIGFVPVAGATTTDEVTPTPNGGSSGGESEAEAKRRQKEFERLQKSLEDKKASIEKFLADREILELDAWSQKEAKLIAQYDKELELARAMGDEGLLYITELEKRKAVDLAILDEQRLAEWETRQEEEALRKIEAMEAEAEAISDAEDLLQEEAFQKRVDAELAIAQAVEEGFDGSYENIRDYYNELLRLAEQYGLDTTEVTKQFNDAKADLNEESLTREIELYGAAYNAIGDLFSSAAKIFFDSEAEQAEFRKISALAEIAYSTAMAIATMTQKAASSSADPLTFGIQLAVSLGTIATSIAKAKAAFEEAPKLPQKKLGGFSNVRGQDDGQMYNAQFIGTPGTGLLNYNNPVTLANEAGPEYFVDNPSLSNPAILAHVQAIDSIKQGVPQKAAGGFSDSGSSTSSSADVELLSMVYRLLKKMDQYGVKLVMKDQDLRNIFDRAEELGIN